LLALFREPEFQFDKLPYDEVAQIGVLIGLQFRTFDDFEFEKELLQEPNFRDLVFKIFVDYGRLNGKYGKWVQYLANFSGIDHESRIFINCIDAWRQILAKETIAQTTVKSLPNLSDELHPILYGRIFGLKLLLATTKKNKMLLLDQMQARLSIQPQFATELLYEPSVQALVTQNQELFEFLQSKQHLVNDIHLWYHYSQVAIHRVFQACAAIKEKQYQKAMNILNLIPYGHIRHGYREFIETYVSFFRWQIVKELKSKQEQKLKEEFLKYRLEINYPLLTDTYFENYFKD
jgi:hypothetical protein